MMVNYSVEVAPRIPETIAGLETIGLEEFYAETAHRVSAFEHQRRIQSLMVARALTNLTVLNATPRVFGEFEGRIKVFEWFKPRTMYVMDEDARAELDDMHRTGTHDKEGVDPGRTPFGALLAGKNIDDIVMTNWWLLGTSQLFGRIRPPLATEFEAEHNLELAAAYGMNPLELARRIDGNIGELTVAGWMGARIMTEENRMKRMEALVMSEDELPSKRDIAKAHISKEFRKQTGGSNKKLRSHLHSILLTSRTAR